MFCFFLFLLQNQYTMAEYNGAVGVIRKTVRWDEGLAPSFSFLLKAGFEFEIVQRSKIYTLNSHLLTLVFLSTFLDTKETRGFFNGLVPSGLRWDPQQKSSQI